MGRKRNHVVYSKAWQGLPDGHTFSFDQTSGALASLDRVEPYDPRPAQRSAEGAIITGLFTNGM